MALIDMRRSQMFPVLNPVQIETARRFASGEPQRFAPNELMFDAGDRLVPTWLVLEGSIEISRHDGRGHVLAIAVEGTGQFRRRSQPTRGAPGRWQPRAPGRLG